MRCKLVQDNENIEQDLCSARTIPDGVKENSTDIFLVQPERELTLFSTITFFFFK